MFTRRLVLRAVVPALVLGAAGVALAHAGGLRPLTKAFAPAGMIQQVDDHTYRVDRAAFAATLGPSPLNAISHSARFVPEAGDDVWSGLRLMSVEPEGPVARLGLRTGDVVRSVNGAILTGPGRALRVYALLKSADHATVAIERNGQPLELVYLLR